MLAEFLAVGAGSRLAVGNGAGTSVMRFSNDSDHQSLSYVVARLGGATAGLQRARRGHGPRVRHAQLDRKKK